MYKKYASTIYTILGIIFIAAIFYLIYRPPRIDTIKPTSTLNLNPTSANPTLSTTVEPTIEAWRIYSNDQFGFKISVPVDWYQQEYDSVANKGEKLIAFSPNPLPCPTCSYVHDGYFSIRIYNQQTSPIFYEDFQQRMSLASTGRQKDYISIQLNKKPGVLFANTVAIENEGWVYEFILDVNDGKTNINDSQTAQKILSSMNFNGLVFDK